MCLHEKRRILFCGNCSKAETRGEKFGILTAYCFLFSLFFLVSSPSRICQLNREDTSHSGVNQCELLLQLITAVNGTAELLVFPLLAGIQGLDGDLVK